MSSILYWLLSLFNLEKLSTAEKTFSLATLKMSKNKKCRKPWWSWKHLRWRVIRWHRPSTQNGSDPSTRNGLRCDRVLGWARFAAQSMDSTEDWKKVIITKHIKKVNRKNMPNILKDVPDWRICSGWGRATSRCNPGRPLHCPRPRLSVWVTSFPSDSILEVNISL